MDIWKLTIDAYLELSGSQLRQLCRDALKLPTHLQVDLDAKGIVVTDSRFDARFRFVPGGTYRIGLSIKEETAARRIHDPFPATLEELRPVVQVKTQPRLVAEVPITNRLAEGVVEHSFNNSDCYPAMLKKAQVDKICEYLGFRLSTEAEWEIACRAGVNSLFVFGDELPDEQVLETWLSWDLSEPTSLPSNRLGLAGLYFGEWCSDRFRNSHADRAAVDETAFVVKGGGAYFWPWQNDEWVWCMSAMRMPSTALPKDGRCAGRLVFDL
jgi:formylglycine-generating enzyme